MESVIFINDIHYLNPTKYLKILLTPKFISILISCAVIDPITVVERFGQIKHGKELTLYTLNT